MEYLNELMFHRHDGARPDVRFYNRAYLLTMHHWSQELRVKDCTLETLVQARTGWTHFWTNFTPSVGAGSSSPAGAGAQDMAMLPPDLVERVNAMAQVTKALQSRMDKQAHAEKRRADAWDDESWAEQEGPMDDGTPAEEDGGRKARKRAYKKRKAWTVRNAAEPW